MIDIRDLNQNMKFAYKFNLRYQACRRMDQRKARCQYGPHYTEEYAKSMGIRTAVSTKNDPHALRDGSCSRKYMGYFLRENRG